MSGSNYFDLTPQMRKAARQELLRQLDAETLDMYEVYELTLLAQIVKGAAEYGDASFARPASQIRLEQAEELIDAGPGWSFVLFCALLKKARAADAAQQTHVMVD